MGPGEILAPFFCVGSVYRGPLRIGKPASSDRGKQQDIARRGILRVPDNWFTRQRFNPFFDYMEERLLDWVGEP